MILNDINSLFENVTKDELIKKFFSAEFTRFFNYYKKSKDLKSQSSSHSQEDYRGDDNSVRFFINIGSKDGYDWMKLKDFLRDTLQLNQEDVYKVDVKDSFAFFNTDESNKAKVLEFFTDFKQDGRFINVEITEKKSRERNRRGGGGGGRRSGGGGYGGGSRHRSGGGNYGGGGRRRNERSNDSGSKSESRGRRSDSDSSSRSPRRSSDFKPSGGDFARARKSRRK